MVLLLLPVLFLKSLQVREYANPIHLLFVGKSLFVSAGHKTEKKLQNI
jgi:hypothetical protein